ncbi:hypothetical protein BHF71_03330 [Vulcanibacillus modesticaldus]|uniref:N-acetyltransferase domain-containing protein n=1 Tax=Vulcanibacillus modesticaldus TaxID=337097 RepID=A0A1D2YST9_9BACI|nr:GNAT family protein [Vulcanibacillus modesticaldus]OEF98065.1 hypothetical protein BHF71_03330 [Vulcanibacillus modesticaldus]
MLKGKLVQLKAVEREDLPKYLEWMNDSEVRQYLAIGISYPLTMTEENDWYESMLKDKSRKTYAIHTIENDQLIGNCSLFNINWKNQSAVTGIFIGDKNYWGKGYGTEALRLLLYLGFQEFNLRRIELGVFEFNDRAIKSYKKLGFVEEGRKRRAIYRNGNFYDEVIMAILREEYLEKFQKEDEERWRQY